jgi:hypothetical protein
MEKEKLLEIRNIIDDIYSNGINELYFKSLYELIGNEEIPIIFNNSSRNTAAFNPKFMDISVNLEKSTNWVSEMVKESTNYFDINNLKLLKSYYYVCLLAHEVEHSNQKLIADGVKKPDYDFKKQAYHDIFGVLHFKEYILPRPVSMIRDIVRFCIYKKNAYDFILERNASIEEFNLPSLVVLEADEKEILEFLIFSRNIYLSLGYLTDGTGPLKYTYKKLGMMKKYRELNIPQNISLTKRIREGLEIPKESADKVIQTLGRKLKLK